MKIEECIKNHLIHRLEEARALVVYDLDRRYSEIVREMTSDKCTLIDGTVSTIIGRESAMDAWCELAISDSNDKKLIIYLPTRKPKTEREHQQNPYEIFALGGGEFPAGDNESYQTLCHQAAPEMTEQIDSLFAAGVPDFATINNLIAGKATWPKLRTLLDAESAVEILTAVMSPSEVQRQALQSDETWVPEFKEFLKATIELKLKTKSKKLNTISDELWRYILFSEFLFDLPVPLPDSLKDVPKAPDTIKGLVYNVCDNLRSSENHQIRYMEKADEVAAELQLVKHMEGIANLGERDTFAFEEMVFLSVFKDAVLNDNSAEANEVFTARSKSIWVRHKAERQQLWTVADRAFQLIAKAKDFQASISSLGNTLAELFDFYCDRFRQIDLLHRGFEQAVADAYGDLEDLDQLVELARREYLRKVEQVQSRFIAAVEQEGWPVSGCTRNTDVFAKYVAPWLEERKKVAYFMVDALRYELAIELGNKLSSPIEPVCAQLPTITAVGMAALLPEAKDLTLVRENDVLVPYLKQRRILSPNDRYEYVRSFLGDRCHMRTLDELISKPKLRIPETTQLLLVRTTDIDQLGEVNPLEAMRNLPKVIQKIIAGINQVQKRGFDRAVLATDHGFITFDEQAIGDTVPKPPGDWLTIKGRCLLGSGSSGPGVLVLKKADIGISGDFEEYAVPRTFGTFARGNPYFHEGLSLQECVLPVIMVDFEKTRVDSSKPVDIRLSYKGGTTNKVTTRRPMIEVVMHQTGFFDQDADFQLEAYCKDELVGEVAACTSVNPATGLVSIGPGKAIKVPLKMAEDFHGTFEVRATDPVTNVNYSILKLKTDYVD